MNHKSIINLFAVITLFLTVACENKESQSPTTLKEALAGKFLMGTAMSAPQITGKDSAQVALIKQHFNSIVAENVMKHEKIHPQQEIFNFELPDKFVEFGHENGMHIVGHTLIWHSQAAPWFFVDSLGNEVSREVLIQRMKTHIHTVVGRYKGRIHGWDVLNEAFDDDGDYRKSKFYTIIGQEYIELAFKFAHEADPNAELYYNDYSMAKPGRRDAVVALVKQLHAKNIRIDAIGMQAHLSMDYPTVDEFEKSIVAFASTGVKVMITELDLTVIPFPGTNVGADVSASFEFKKEFDPYADGLPDSVEMLVNERYLSFFKLFQKHENEISRVTMWGVNDAQSWRNYWPIEGRTDYPLLFDRQNKPKKIVTLLINSTW